MQKNDTLVRAYLGQARLDTAEQCAILNVLYDQLWVYYNLFQPVLHLVEKTHDGARVHRRWDDAQTPLARLLATNTLNPSVRERLERLYAETNPRALRRTIQAGLNALLYPRPSVVAPIATCADEPAATRAAS